MLEIANVVCESTIHRVQTTMGTRSGTTNGGCTTSERGDFQPFVDPQPGCILVVDDDPEVLDMMDAILTSAGYDVETATNGLEALALLPSITPAMIFLDINMPMMDGVQFREAQRRDRNLIRIPTIVMTGGDVHPLLDLAVDETMRKPARKADVLAVALRYCIPAVASDT